MNYVNDLREWRKERDITKADYLVFVGNVLEELLEPLYTKSQVEANKEEIMLEYFTFANKENIAEEFEIIDTIQDIQVFCINETELMGYDNNLTMNETIKEISSRVQNPQQKLEWQEKGAVGKWQKWQEQSKDTLYKASYIDCKLPK